MYCSILHPTTLVTFGLSLVPVVVNCISEREPLPFVRTHKRTMIIIFNFMYQREKALVNSNEM